MTRLGSSGEWICLDKVGFWTCNLRVQYLKWAVAYNTFSLSFFCFLFFWFFFLMRNNKIYNTNTKETERNNRNSKITQQNSKWELYAMKVCDWRWGLTASGGAKAGKIVVVWNKGDWWWLVSGLGSGGDSTILTVVSWGWSWISVSGGLMGLVWVNLFMFYLACGLWVMWS